MAIVTDAEVMAFLGLDATGIFTITAANDRLKLKSSEGGPVDIDIPHETYEGLELAAALTTAMNNSGTLKGSVITFTVTYSSDKLFIIDATLGHTIEYTHSGSDAGTTFGFTTDSTTGQQTITSDTAVSGEPQDTISTIHAGVEGAITQYCHRTFDSTTYLHEQHDGNGTADIFLNQYPIISITQVAIGEMAGIAVKNTDTTATRAAIDVDPDNTLMTLTVAGVSASQATIDLSDSSYNSLDKVVTQINTLSSNGWSAGISDANYGDLLSTELLPVMGVSVGSRGGTAASWSYLNVPTNIISVRYTAESGGIHYGAGFPSGFQNVITTYTAGYSPMRGDLKMAVYMWVKAVYSGLEDDSFGIKTWRTGDISVTYAAAISQMPDETMQILRNYVKADMA